jgi:hypothetical protein
MPREDTRDRRNLLRSVGLAEQAIPQVRAAMSAQAAQGPVTAAEYRSAFYPDHVLEAFGVWREPGREGQYGGYCGQATWRGKDGTSATTYCGCPHFTEDGALACIKRWHEVHPRDTQLDVGRSGQEG